MLTGNIHAALKANLPIARLANRSEQIKIDV